MDRRKGESIFSYPVTRPYPFRWFTWVVTIGGAIFVVLFSFVALAADGYNIDLEYTSDLNGTLNADYWFQKAPFSWVSKTRASCQPALLTTGSTYFTSNLGYIYTIDRLWREDSIGRENRVLPAAAYQNTLLRDCEVRAITINFIRSDEQRLAVGNPWVWASTTASATVTCTFDTSSGAAKANLTTRLPEIRDTSGIRSSVLSANANVSEHGNIWFGAQFTYAWYQQISQAIGSTAPPNENFTWESGFVTLSRNPNTDDYTDLRFFYCLVNFFTSPAGVSWMTPPHTVADWANPIENGPTVYPNGTITGFILPNITATIDTFAKSFYSLLMSDFGVVSQANALLTPSGVQWLGSQVDGDLERNSNYTSGRPENVQNPFNKQGATYPINQTYQSVVNHLGRPPNLNSTPSSAFYTQYLCSLPNRKAGGALFFAVLLADLVFLQAVWTLFNLGAVWWLQRKYEQVNYCDGCRTRGVSVTAGKHVSSSSEYQLLGISPSR